MSCMCIDYHMLKQEGHIITIGKAESEENFHHDSSINATIGEHSAKFLSETEVIDRISTESKSVHV